MFIRFLLIFSIIKNFFAIPFSLNPATFVIEGQKSQKITYKIGGKKKESKNYMINQSTYKLKKKKKTVQKHESTTSDILKLNSSQLIQMLTKTK